jgi:hypothetical protein
MTENLIIDAQERKYFTMLPNVVDDLGLSVYAFRLYCHIRRVTGEDGKCWQSTETLAKASGMSVHAVVDAKRELAAANLVTITTVKRPGGGRAFHVITIRDIWERNLKHCTGLKSGQDDTTKGRLPTRNDDVPTGNLQVPDVQRKKNPQEEGTGRGGRVSHTPAGENPPPPASENVAASIFRPIPRTHPAIVAYKQVTGRYPRRNLHRRIVNLLGETPDIERMQLTFDSWTAGGRNPQNVKGWLFDWYRESMAYVPEGDKFKD